MARLRPAVAFLVLVLLGLTAKVPYRAALWREGSTASPQGWQHGSSERGSGAVGRGLLHESPPPGQDDGYLAMCIAVKDEHCDIREWVLYHASIGASKFYIFDTESDPPMRGVLEDLTASGLVEYSFVTNTSAELELAPPKPGETYNWQVPVFSLCLRRYGARHRWMAFVDADEFIVLQGGPGSTPPPPSLPPLLQRHEQHGGLALHWRQFASGGQVLRPVGGVLSTYTACTEELKATVIKSVVQPRFVNRTRTVHSFVYVEGKHAVNTAGSRIEGGNRRNPVPPSYQGAALHHYVTKSLEDFNAKMRRRAGSGLVRDLDYFLDTYRACGKVCSQAVEAGRALERRFDLRRGVPDKCLPPGERQQGQQGQQQQGGDVTEE